MPYKILHLPTGEFLKEQIYPFELERVFSNKRKAKRFIKRRIEGWDNWYNWSDESGSHSWRVIENTDIPVIKAHLEIIEVK